MIPQPGVSLISLNLKNTSQKTVTGDSENEQSGDHDVVLFPTAVSGDQVPAIALPVNFAIISSVSSRSSLGR